MAVNLSPVFGVAGQLFDNNGNPLAGGKIYTYLAGTTTNAATYTSSSGAIAHSNPIVLDGAGRVPSGEIWLTDGITYKFVVEDSASNLIGTYDNLSGINSNFIAYTAQQEIQTATAGQTVFTLTTMQYQPNTNNLSVFVDGVNQYGPGAQYAFVETSSTVITFVSGLHVGASVKFTTASPVASNVTDAENVTYDPPFTGSVVTNVEAKLSEYVSVKDFGAVGDGVTDDVFAIQDALNSGAKNIYFPAGNYKIISGSLNITNSVTLFGDGNDSEISTSLNGAPLFDVTASNVVFDGLRLVGRQHAAYVNQEWGIYAHGTLGTYLTDITVQNCTIENFGREAVHLVYAYRVNVLNCHLFECARGGIVAYQVSSCKFALNTIEDIAPGDGSGNAYGIGIASDGTAPCAYNVISDNLISNILVWGGVVLEPSSHSTVANNIILGCKLGIDCGAWAGGTYTSDYCTITGNIIDASINIAAGGAYYGIGTGGPNNSNQNIGCTITGNTIVGYGATTPSDFGAIYLRYFKNVVVDGNFIYDSFRSAIQIGAGYVSGVISNNVIEGLSATTPQSLIYVVGGNNDLLIENNKIIAGASTVFTSLVSASNGVTIGTNEISGTGTYLGSGYGDYLFLNYSDSANAVSTSGTGEDTLKSTSISAGKLNKQSVIQIKANGDMTGSAGNKTIKLYFGSTAFTVYPAANGTGLWNLEATITNRNDLASQFVQYQLIQGTTVITQTTTTSTENTATAKTVSITGECANSADAISQIMFLISLN